MVDSTHMLFGVPNYDAATNYLYRNFIYYYIPYAQNKGLWTIHECLEYDCNRDYVHNEIQIHQPKGILQGAHGGPYTMGGQNPEYPPSGGNTWMVYIGGEDHPTCVNAAGKIIYFISCHCGAYLGPRLVNHWGASAWAGYDDLCYVSTSQRYRECLGEFWMALCDGDTVGEAFARAISKYNYWINIYPSANLIWNRDHFMMLGNTQDTLLPENLIVDDSIQFTIHVQ